MDAAAGVTSIVTRTTGGGTFVTSSTATLLLMPFEEAVISVLPSRMAVANPLLSMVATPERELFQLTNVVRSWVLPSL